MKLFIFRSLIFVIFLFLFSPKVNATELAPGSVWQWDSKTLLSTKSAELNDIVSVSAGTTHSLALKADGTVWAWGSNQWGELGNGESGGSSADPVQVKSPDGLGYLTDVKAIAAGASWYSLALKNDGTVWTWGYNGYGVRGTGIGTSTITDGSSKLLTPTQVKTSGGLTSIIAIAAGGNHSLGLKSDGNVFAWGQNNNGQIGIGCFLYNCSIALQPWQVISNVVSIAAGDRHSLAVKTDGSVWGWGTTSEGQLASVSNTFGVQAKPVQIPGIEGIRSVSSKDYFSAALSESGKVFVWGDTDYWSPDKSIREVAELTDVKIVDVGISVGAAVKNDGTIWQWNVILNDTPREVPNLSNIGSISTGRYIGNFASVFTPLSVSTPEPPETSLKTPLIFIPGMAGSELKTSETVNWFQPDGHSQNDSFAHFYPEGEKVWVNTLEAIKPGNDDYFDILRMSENGQSSIADLALTGTLFDGYQGAIDFFVSNGYTLNQDFFIFPYDWRKDISATASLLDEKIESIKQQAGSTKVDIIAHSMGGLAARNYIKDPEKAQNVRKLFTLGTPHLGSVKFLKALKYGDCLKYEIGSTCLSIASSELKDVVQNMISAYQLAPSQEYFNFYSGNKNYPYPYKTESGALNYAQIKNLLTEFNHNTSLFTPSEDFHNLDSLLSNTNGVDVTVIAGSGRATLGQIIEEKRKNLFGKEYVHKDILNINGDETVPLFSASLNDSSRNLSLLGLAKAYYTNQEHGELVTSGPALNLVKNILNSVNNLPDGVSSEPYPFKGTKVSVHSPVNIHVYDALGNHTGPLANGDFEANIPGSLYDSLDDAKFIWLPDDGEYSIKFEATGEGNFDFKIDQYENNENTKTILYNDIPLTENTKAETSYNSSSEPPILFVDNDGNGTIDLNVNPSSILTGDNVSDQTAPQTTIELSGTEGLNGWYKSDVIVTLNSQDDENGSGILKTEYSMDDGETINIYTEPFTISKEAISKLKFRSIDNAGNEEEPREIEIKIDKTSPEAKIFIDISKRDLAVAGVDANPTAITFTSDTSTKRNDDFIYMITDLAGNNLRLVVHDKDKQNQNRLRIHSLTYNNESEIIEPRNYFTVDYENKDPFYIKRQVFELEDSKIRIVYDSKKNRSIYTIKETKDERVVETREGLEIMEVFTDKGHLKASY